MPIDLGQSIGQFYAYRLDRNCNDRDVIIYVREDIPGKILEKHKLPQDVEVCLLN